MCYVALEVIVLSESSYKVSKFQIQIGFALKSRKLEQRTPKQLQEHDFTVGPRGFQGND